MILQQHRLSAEVRMVGHRQQSQVLARIAVSMDRVVVRELVACADLSRLFLAHALRIEITTGQTAVVVLER